MDYPLENLGPDRFQELCQSLLARQFPDLQCFPLYRADGGRDALLLPDGDLTRSIVFQVKFTENPRVKTPREYMSGIIHKEKEKVEALAKRGVARYCILTNVKGTGTPDSGSMDTVSKELQDALPIPASCWWRDDICRRLDDAWGIKLSFHEVLRNVDILLLSANRSHETDDERRIRTLRAFLRDHYERDRELRFNQIELRSEILDLFIDVPVDLTVQVRRAHLEPVRHAATNKFDRIFAQIANDTLDEDSEGLPRILDTTHMRLGAASFLLHPLAQGSEMQVVVEGAPGQGKSTMTQYVCQVHRHRLLGERHERLSSDHASCPVRLPFRVDCRDLAAWLDHECPFRLDNDSTQMIYPNRTVESFLAAQVHDGSGGATFSIDDLIAVLRLMPAMLFFDGLDEVADVKRRREVVDAIEKGIARIRANAQSLQVVVTSRPAVFSNSPALPERAFPHLHLAPIGAHAIKNYAGLWLKAQQLSKRESEDVQDVLDSKLDQPHIQELARNPMQLSILLSLIRSHGSSLPDMRTTLYDSYVERAFNREAGKSQVVREYRNLFVDLHRYVAWVLHSEAETGDGGGRIDEQRLKHLVQNYLRVEGYERINVEYLFSGMVERIVALVSRVEGTFEFEVQPLREYFAAKYLYVTAPYSPPGRPKSGTKPERFDALARNFFWQNVTRFYAGCYDRGELWALVESLDALVDEDGYKSIGYPQTMAAALLADWVFVQYPKVMRRVVSIILDGLNAHRVIADRFGQRSVLRLPLDCGGRELVERCFDLLAERQPEDFATSLVDLVIENSDVYERVSLWCARSDNLSPTALAAWMTHGLWMDVLSYVPAEDLEHLLECASSECLWLVSCAGRDDLITREPARIEKVVYFILEGRTNLVRWNTNLLGTFASMLMVQRYMVGFNEKTSEPLVSMWSIYRAWEVEDFSLVGGTPLEQRCAEFVATAVALAREHSSISWSTTLDPWRQLVSKGRSLFGDQWAWVTLANTAAGIGSLKERGVGTNQLLDSELDLCDRIRYARLQASAWRWWKAQLENCSSSGDQMLCLLVVLSWGGRAVFKNLSELVNDMLCSLSTDDWARLQKALPSEAIRYRFGTRWLSVDFGSLPDSLSKRFVVSISPRIRHRDRLELYKRYMADSLDGERAILEFSQGLARREMLIHPEDWRTWLPVVEGTYSHGVVAEQYGYGRERERRRPMPFALAKEVAGRCDRYPVELVEAAWGVVRYGVAKKITPLGRVAEQEEWFLASAST